MVKVRGAPDCLKSQFYWIMTNEFGAIYCPLGGVIVNSGVWYDQSIGGPVERCDLDTVFDSNFTSHLGEVIETT